MTGFSTVPLQLFSAFGIAVSLLSTLLFVILAVRRIFLGSEAEGVFTLFALAFAFISAALFGIGLLGEYVGRIYEEVRQRPRYIVGTVWEQPAEAASPQPKPELPAARKESPPQQPLALTPVEPASQREPVSQALPLQHPDPVRERKPERA
jgi:hypothetical protein